MKPRRSQATRRREMRAALLEATVACLAEHGYAGATTARICERAGVSRGASVHYFPHKHDLLVAAVEHVFDRRRSTLRAALADVPPGAERIVHGIDRMWEAVQGGPTDAWLELVVAARTDPVLHARVVAATDRLRVAAAEELAQLVEGASLPPGALELASAVMDGLAVQHAAGLDADRRRTVLDLLKALVRTFVPAPPHTPETP